MSLVDRLIGLLEECPGLKPHANPKSKSGFFQHHLKSPRYSRKAKRLFQQRLEAPR